MKKRIGMVGTSISQEALKERGKGWELWGLNSLYSLWPEVEFAEWFELHSFGLDDGIYTRRGIPFYPIYSEKSVREYMDELDRLKIPVWMQREWKEIGKSRIFPFEEIMRKFGRYMGCSFAWMTAHAIMQGADEIGYFGIPLNGNEYYYQRPSVERLIGYAEASGISIYVDETSDLLKAGYVYAYEEDFDLIYMIHGSFMNELLMTLGVGIQQVIEHRFYQTKGEDR